MTESFARFRSLPLSIRLLFLAGNIIVGIFLVFAIFAEFIAPYDPLLPSPRKLAQPSLSHLMGTDMLGRDIFSRVVFGSRVTLMTGALSVSISSFVGTLLGMISGYLGGKIDRLVSLCLDSLYAFPSFLIALVISVMLGVGVLNTSIAVSICWIPLFNRVARSVTLSVKERQFIEVSRVLGAKHLHIVIRHILPHCLSSVFVLITLGFVRAVITIAGLGFLGFGIPPPTPEWGTDLSLGRSTLLSGAWWPILFPGLMLTVLAVGFSMVSEGLNPIMNPASERV